MLRTSIIGWYGTETMGDLAILDGILAVLNSVSPTSRVHLGSLYPFYSERTMLQERPVFEKTAPGAEIRIFEIMDRAATEEVLDDTDILIFGGGPLMDLEELYLMHRTVKSAARRNIPIVLMGCGLGPVREEGYIRLIGDMVRMSSRTIWRDEGSMQLAERLGMDTARMCVIGDPARISVDEYGTGHPEHHIQEDTWAVNLRRFPEAEYGANPFDAGGAAAILAEAGKYCRKLQLVPMHTFAIGGDDRDFFAEIMGERDKPDTEVLWKPLNLHELYDIYASAGACIGMRYHAVLMQTLLNGNNYIFDYTAGAGDKTAGFLRQADPKHFYRDRIWNMREEQKPAGLEALCRGERFSGRMDSPLKEYKKELSDLIG